MNTVELHRLAHQAGAFSGAAGLPFVERIGGLVRRYEAKTLLDYGCGNASLYRVHRAHEHWGVMPALYDPAVEEFAALPVGPFDGVICTDVMEHIEEEHVDATIASILSLARVFVFVSICCRPANQKLPDGSNAHRTVRPSKWWMERFMIKEAEGRHLIVTFTP